LAACEARVTTVEGVADRCHEQGRSNNEKDMHSCGWCRERIVEVVNTKTSFVVLLIKGVWIRGKDDCLLRKTAGKGLIEVLSRNLPQFASTVVNVLLNCKLL